MNKFLMIFGCISACLLGSSATAVSAGTTANNGRAMIYTNSAGASTGGTRGQQGLVNAYQQNQRNTYFLVTQPDVDTACRQKIYNCLAEYCGDAIIVPGKTSGRCSYATEIELYNYALLCLQKDTSILLPQYSTGTKNNIGGTNTAARLCPSYVQQELMSYLSMMNMADKLTKSHSDLCLQRRHELEAAMACHSVALAYGNETTSMLKNRLMESCGVGVTGGSSEMISRFLNAGNMGADIWGWADKIIGLEMNAKGKNWEAAVDAVLADYTNRMNLACGDNLQLNTVPHASTNTGYTNLQNAVAVAANIAMPTATTNTFNPYETQAIAKEVTSLYDIYEFNIAKDVVQFGLTNNALTPNAYLTSAQMDSMQQAYKLGTKVFIVRDTARCFIVPVATLTQNETSLVSQAYATCVSR